MFKVHGPSSRLTISVIPYTDMFEGTWTLIGLGSEVTSWKEMLHKSSMMYLQKKQLVRIMINIGFIAQVVIKLSSRENDARRQGTWGALPGAHGSTELRM